MSKTSHEAGVGPLAGAAGSALPADGQPLIVPEAVAGLLEIISDAACVYDPATLDVLEVNAAFIARFGHSRQEARTMTMADVWLEEDVAAHREERARPGERGLQRIRRMDGTVDLVDTRTATIDGDGREICILVASAPAADQAPFDHLREQAAFFRKVIDIIPSSVFAKDRDGRFILGNQALADLYGTTVEGILGKTDAELAFDFADAELSRLSDLEAMKSPQGSFVPEEKFTDARGELHWLETVKRPIAGDDGQVDRILGVSVDITARKRGEDELRRTEERFRLVASATNDVVWDWDFSTQDVWWNEGLRTCFGYDPDAPENETWWSDQLHPSDRARVLAGMEQAIAGAGSDWQAEYRLRKSDGQYADIVDRGFISRDDAGKAVRMIGALRDVTAHKRSTETLRASEERYRYLFENNPQPMWVFDETTLGFLAVNTAACLRYGHTREEFLELTVADFKPPEGTAEPRESGIWAHRRKDGVLVEVEVTSHPLLFENRSARLVLAADITERRRLESELRQSQKMEAVGQLAGGIAHDFNNLLTAILGYADLLAAQLPKDEVLQGEVAEITKAGERAATLTRQLLAFSRRQVLEPKRLNLNVVVRGMENMVRRLIGEHIDLVVTLAPSLSTVRADAGQIEQVILNLAVNSRDAMPEGGRLILETADVELDEAFALQHTTVRPGPHVMLAVSDTGGGMDAVTLSRIFEPFFTTKPKDAGTGLGLSTVYGIVKQSGGSIWTYSEIGKGTTFKVYLPRTEGPAEETERAVGELPAKTPTETILLVEDDPALRKLALQVLTGLGYTVLQAGSGGGALDLARGHAAGIDLVLTDVIMPRMNGSEFVSRLRATRPEVSVLYMSGYTDDAIIQNNVLEARAAFLQKPFTPGTLARKIREVLSSRE